MGTTATMTEFAALPDEPGEQELLKGELIRVPPPKAIHALIRQLVMKTLSAYVDERGLGKILANTGFRITATEPSRLSRPSRKGYFAKRACFLD